MIVRKLQVFTRKISSKGIDKYIEKIIVITQNLQCHNNFKLSGNNIFLNSDYPFRNSVS